MTGLKHNIFTLQLLGHYDCSSEQQNSAATETVCAFYSAEPAEGKPVESPCGKVDQDPVMTLQIVSGKKPVKIVGQAQLRIRLQL